MNVNDINPVQFPDSTPGQTVTRQVVVTGVDQETATNVDLTITVSADGNDDVSTPVSVSIDPTQAVPVGTVDVPAGTAVTATLTGFGPVLGAGNEVSYWVANLTITTV